jgi:hypothetical protein
MFSSPVSIKLSSGTSRNVLPRRRSKPISILLTRSACGVSAVPDRIGQMIIQSGLHLADEFSEAEHHAEFIRLDAEEAGKAPQHDRR